MHMYYKKGCIKRVYMMGLSEPTVASACWRVSAWLLFRPQIWMPQHSQLGTEGWEDYQRVTSL